MKYLSICICFILLLASCARYSSAVKKNQKINDLNNRVTIINGSPGELAQKALEWCTLNGFIIKNYTKDDGILICEKSFNPDQIPEYADCGKPGLGAFITSPTQTMNIVINTERIGESRVVVSSEFTCTLKTFMDTYESNQKIVCSTDGSLEKKLIMYLTSK